MQIYVLVSMLQNIHTQTLKKPPFGFTQTEEFQNTTSKKKKNSDEGEKFSLTKATKNRATTLDD